MELPIIPASEEARPSVVALRAEIKRLRDEIDRLSSSVAILLNQLRLIGASKAQLAEIRKLIGADQQSQAKEG